MKCATLPLPGISRGKNLGFMDKTTKIILKGIISVVCLLFFVSATHADPSKEIPGLVYKEMRPPKIPFDPGKIPDPFLSYLVKRGQQASAKAEDDFVWVLESAKNKPSPIDAYFGGVYYIGPIFTAFRGTDKAVNYYKLLRKEIEQRIAAGKGPITPEGDMKDERYRLVVEGPPNWTNFREFWKMFYEDGAVVVASTYTKVGGVYDLGFRHDPDNPIETLADYCLGCYTNRNLSQRDRKSTRLNSSHTDISRMPSSP